MDKDILSHKVRDEILDKVLDQIEEQIVGPVWYQVGSEILDDVWYWIELQMEGQIRSEIWDQTLKILYLREGLLR